MRLLIDRCLCVIHVSSIAQERVDNITSGESRQFSCKGKAFAGQKLCFCTFSVLGITQLGVLAAGGRVDRVQDRVAPTTLSSSA